MAQSVEDYSAESPAGTSNLSSLQSSRRAPLKEGEWACVDAKCAFVNPETIELCEKCGKDKPKLRSNDGKEIGKDFAEKSKGLFSPQDWACTKCGNVNWARRDVCNVCKTKKFGGNEVRTGYGGGFMDRQQVEYKARHVNDEFDEFGRRKNKKGCNENSRDDEHNGIDDEKTDKVHEDSTSSYVDEDDDDESDDADLGKYDLGSDDEFESLKTSLAARVASTGGANAVNGSSRASSPCSCSCSEDETCSCDELEEPIHRECKDQRARSDRNRNGRSEARHRYERDRDHREGSRASNYDDVERRDDRGRKRTEGSRYNEDRSRDRYVNDHDRNSRDRRYRDGRSRSDSQSPPRHVARRF